MPGYESFSESYDRLMSDVDYPALSEYLCGLLQEMGIRDGLLLDVACGTGTLSLLLSDGGYEVIGTDASAQMLSRAQSKALQDGKDVLFLCQDIQSLDLYGTVDAAVCTLDGINHLTDEAAVQAAFDRIALFINPGGAFIFDVNTVYKHRQILADNTFVIDTEDVYCVWQNFLREDGYTVDMELDLFEKDGDVYRRSFESVSERAYTDAQLRRMLGKAGFSVVDVCDFLQKSPVRPDSEKAVYVCRKGTGQGSI